MLDTIQNTIVRQTPPANAISAQTSVNKVMQAQQDKEFGFEDFLDILNPLHHIPIISQIYKNESGDDISNDAKAAGDVLYGALTGGILGIFSAIGNAFLKEQTDKDIGEHIIDLATGSKAGEKSSPNVASYFPSEQYDDPFQSMTSYNFNANANANANSSSSVEFASSEPKFQQIDTQNLNFKNNLAKNQSSKENLNNDIWSIRMKQIYGDDFSSWLLKFINYTDRANFVKRRI
jgi:hypothetical protein